MSTANQNQRGKRKGKRKGKKSKSQLKQEKASGKKVSQVLSTPEIPAFVVAQQNGDFKTFSKDVHIPNFTMARPGGGSELLLETDVQLTHGRKYGLIGPNGHGKTTLLTQLASYQIPEFPKHLRVLHVKQEMPGDEHSVLDAVLRADEERNMLKTEEANLIALQNSSHEHGSEETHSDRLHEIYERLNQIDAASAPARAAIVLSGLHFSEAMQGMPTNDLSGGWRMRVSLACALFVEPDVLLLDEPTNHLDFPAVEWLTEYLQGYSKTLVIVSHDRTFLNDVCTDIIHIEDQKLKYYKGDYDTFEKVRLEKRKQQKTAFDKQQATIEHNEDFIRRFRANKKLASLAQSRVRLLAGMDRLDDVKDDFKFRFRFPEPGPLKKDVLLSVDDMAFGYYGDDRKTFLFENVNLKLKVGTVVGILGENGAGKSTLINLVLRKLEPVRGKMVLNNSANIGFFAQHATENLDMDASPVEFLKAQFPEAKHQEIYHKLGQFNLTRTCATQTIKLLSGGEKSRVSFAVLTWHHPHLLVMDEPTNHLDLDTIDGLITAIQHYEGGAVLLISHDQHFLSSVCNEFWAIGSNKVVKAFATLSDAKKFSYHKKRSIIVGPRTEQSLEQKLSESLSKIELNGISDEKSNGIIEKKSKKSKKKKAMFAFESEEDVLHLVERAIEQHKTPSQMLRILQSSNPDPDTILIAKALSNRLFTEYFSNSSSEDEIQRWAPLLHHMIPDSHKNNQVIVLFTAQSIWHTSLSNQTNSCTEEALLSIFMRLFELKVISPAAFRQWKDDTSNKARGKSEALKQVSKWLETNC
uniref:ATPbinding cassette protein n=1 Tax=Hirondellea gigas TaxID=1518452 RepID=A0A6A7G2R9_9CRUS